MCQAPIGGDSAQIRYAPRALVWLDGAALACYHRRWEIRRGESGRSKALAPTGLKGLLDGGWTPCSRGEPGYESAFAERLLLGGQDAVVFFTGSWLHVLVPPDRREDVGLIRRAVAYGARRVQALGRDSFSTLLPLPLADDVRAVRGIYPSESHFHFHMWMPLKES